MEIWTEENIYREKDTDRERDRSLEICNEENIYIVKKYRYRETEAWKYAMKKINTE